MFSGQFIIRKSKRRRVDERREEERKICSPSAVAYASAVAMIFLAHVWQTRVNVRRVVVVVVLARYRP